MSSTASSVDAAARSLWIADPPATFEQLQAAVRALWNSDPPAAFERLRDLTCGAMQIAIAVYETARSCPKDLPLSSVCHDRHFELHQTVIEAQALWFDTPIRRYIDRADSPVHLDTMPDRTVGRVSGSSYHELAMMIPATLLRTIQTTCTARGWFNNVIFATAAGDAVASRWNELLAHVGVECRAGIDRWKAEHSQERTAPGSTPATAVAPEVPALTGDDSRSSAVSWQEAAERMERLRSQGTRWPGHRVIAERFGCSTTTTVRAVKQTPSLQTWAKGDSAPRAQSITAVVTDRAAQHTEADPADDVAIREYLEKDISPDERAWFNSMSREDQLAFLDDPDKHQKILDRKP